MKHTPADTSKILSLAHEAHVDWKKNSVKERSDKVRNLANMFRTKKDELALICTQEMGKLLKEAEAEVEKCALVCEYYAEHAESFLRDEEIKTEGQSSYVTFQPLGVVLAVMPWNFPYWQVMRFAAPALCAGNGIVLKHASNVPRCSEALEKLFQEAGLPQNIFRSLYIHSDEVPEIIKHSLVKAVTLTGSTAAGKSVAKIAGEALKKCVLELGGSDAYLILEDADVASAAKTLVLGRMLNAGQSCISPKRLIVMDQIFEEFKKAVLQEIKNITIAPMAKNDLRDELHAQVTKSLSQGAKLLAGGEIPDPSKAYYPPTVLSDVKPGMSAFDEELFGPVVCLIRARDEDEAILLANQSAFGLGGGVFSQNIERAQKLALQFEAGGVFINDFLKSNPRLPFGGVKESGFGRELSELGMKEFMNAKTIFVK